MKKVLARLLCLILALSLLLPSFIQKSNAYVYGQTDYYGTITDVSFGTREKLFSFYSNNGYYQYNSGSDYISSDTVTKVTIEFPIIMSTNGKTRLDTGRDEDYTFVTRFEWGCKIYIDGNVIFDIPEEYGTKTIAINLTENTKVYNENVDTLFTERISDGSHTFRVEYNQPQGRVNNLIIIQTFPNSWIQARHYDVMTREKICNDVIYAAEAEGVYIDIHPTEIKGYSHTSGNPNYIYPNVPAQNGGRGLDMYYDYVGGIEEEIEPEEDPIIDPVIEIPENTEEENKNDEDNKENENKDNIVEEKENIEDEGSNSESNKKDNEDKGNDSKEDKKLNNTSEDKKVEKIKETVIKKKEDVKASNRRIINSINDLTEEERADYENRIGGNSSKGNKTLGVKEIDIVDQVAERVDRLVDEKKEKRTQEIAKGIPEDEATKVSVTSQEIEAIRENVIQEEFVKMLDEQAALENTTKNEAEKETNEVAEYIPSEMVVKNTNSPSVVGVILTLGLLTFIVIFIIYLVKESKKDDEDEEDNKNKEEDNN